MRRPTTRTSSTRTRPSPSAGSRWTPRPRATTPLAADATRFNRLEGAFFKGGAFWFDDTAGGESRWARSTATCRRPTPSSSSTRAPTRTASRAPTTSRSRPGATCGWQRTATSATASSASPPRGAPTCSPTTASRSRAPRACPRAIPASARSSRADLLARRPTFFVNIQSPGITYAVWGPVQGAERGQAAPDGPRGRAEGPAPARLGELSEAAQRHGMTELEAAAFDRLGVPLA
jgi:hypothetical protein